MKQWRLTNKVRQAKRRLRIATVKALEESCLLVEGRAVLLAPVGLTGNLRDSIEHWVSVSELTGYVGTNAHYAAYVEFGTGMYAESGNGRKGGWIYKSAVDGQFYFTWGMDPQPYLRPAFRQSKGEIKAIFKKIMGDM